MNEEILKIIEKYKQEADAFFKEGDYGSALFAYEKALEEFSKLETDESTFEVITNYDRELKCEIEKAVKKTKHQLAKKHFELANKALQNKEYNLAIDEVETAIELADEGDEQFLLEAKKILDKASIKAQEHKLYLEGTPFVERGDSLRNSGNYAEAILEYQEALKIFGGLKSDHRYVVYVKEALQECRRNLVKPYLARVYKAFHLGRYKLSLNLLKRANILLDENDYIYKAFLKQIENSILEKLQIKEDETEEVDSPEVWAKAIKDYEEALDLYTSFTLHDPLSPIYNKTNIYEDKFIEAKRNLANLYKARGDKFRDQLKLEKAIKNYKEALKLYPRTDKMFHETFKELKKLRAQLG